MTAASLHVPAGPVPPLRGNASLPAALDGLLPQIRGLADDSRQIAPGMAFAAYPGVAGDGRPWMADAVARGAVAVFWDPAGHPAPVLTVPALAVPGLRERAGYLAARIHGDPSAALQVIGVTGTNGKTSCTHWLAQALGDSGRLCGLVGTLGSGLPGALQPSGFTTPGPVTVQAHLAALRDAGAVAVAMEVSSHALAQNRVQAVHFDLALFTNLTRDHLDFHGDMQAYGRAKAALFHAAGLRKAILNLDDAFGAALHAELAQAGVPVLGYSQRGPLAVSLPAVTAEQVHFHPGGFACVLRTPHGSVPVAGALVGSFNLSNLLGVVACLLESGVDLADLPARVARLTPPPGRLQALANPGGAQVLVDYAHTPDALAEVLRALRASLQGGRLICLFGCGGDRDAGKRPLMGRLAEQLADIVVLTSDNPRSEDPASILDAIAAGMHRAPYAQVVDRGCAIALAIELARPGDIVLIAGKGHETTQEIQGQKLPFSDLAVARRVLGLPEQAA